MSHPSRRHSSSSARASRSRSSSSWKSYHQLHSLSLSYSLRCSPTCYLFGWIDPVLSHHTRGDYSSSGSFTTSRSGSARRIGWSYCCCAPSVSANRYCGLRSGPPTLFCPTDGRSFAATGYNNGSGCFAASRSRGCTNLGKRGCCRRTLFSHGGSAAFRLSAPISWATCLGC